MWSHSALLVTSALVLTVFALVISVCNADRKYDYSSAKYHTRKLPKSHSSNQSKVYPSFLKSGGQKAKMKLYHNTIKVPVVDGRKVSNDRIEAMHKYSIQPYVRSYARDWSRNHGNYTVASVLPLEERFRYTYDENVPYDNDRFPPYYGYIDKYEGERPAEEDSNLFLQTIAGGKILKFGKIVVVFAMLVIVSIFAEVTQAGFEFAPVALPLALIPLGVVVVIPAIIPFLSRTFSVIEEAEEREDEIEDWRKWKRNKRSALILPLREHRIPDLSFLRFANKFRNVDKNFRQYS